MKKTQHKKVWFEFWNKDGFQRSWTYGKRHMRFTEADIPLLFQRAVSMFSLDEHRTKYLSRIASNGIHIALFCDGFEPNVAKGQLQALTAAKDDPPAPTDP